MTIEHNKNFERSTKCCICGNAFVEGDAKVRDPCHVTGKYRGTKHRDCNINVSLNYKVPVVFPNLKNYNVHIIMQKLGKCDFKINVIPNRL